MTSYMKKFNFKSKLYIGIAIAIILVVAMSSLFYYTNVKERQSELWVTHSIDVKSKLQEINTRLNNNAKINRAKRRYKDVDNIFQNSNDNDVFASVGDLKLMVQDNKIQSANVVHLKSQINKIFDLWRSINLNETRDDDVKEEIYFRQEVKIMDEIKISIDDMDAHENMLLIERRATNQQSMDVNNVVTIIGSILILAVVLTLGYNITSEFRKRSIVELSLKDRMDDQAALNAQIALNNGVLVGVQKVMEASQKNKDVSSFLQTILDGIIDFTEITSGVIYLVNETDVKNRLTPAVSRGVAIESIKETNLNMLLAHQRDNDKPIVYVENIPAGFWHLASATGKMLPGAIVYIFVKFKERLLCVLELAFFQSPGERERAFLNMLPGAIAVRLSALQVTENRDQLMQELQEKQEILLNQQEELQQSNEELLHQTSILQASEEELRVQEEELKQINTELEEKHDALELAKEAMDLKATELEQSTKYKSEFLANMSHELRTPLNSILILANLLGDNRDKNLTGKQVEYARIIGNSGSDLLKLINDILDLSKIEAGKIDLSIEQVPVSSIVKHMKETFEVISEMKKIRFSVNVDPDAATAINTDIQRLEQILKNLLSNALKFTTEGGKVSLNIKMANPNTISFEVSDSGIGIDPSKLELIFEAFKQEDGSTNRKYGGTGLGLSISRELTKMLKGKLTVDSKLKEGSTFRLSLPLIIAEESAKTATQHKLPAGIEENKLSGAGKTILIVEDDPVFSNILKNYAEEKSYKTLTAVNGQEGLEMAKRHKPDAIILDLQMPIMNGWEVLKELRVDPELRSIPVHVISAMDEDKAPVNGIVEYVRKPVTIDELEHTFNHIGSYIAAVKHRLLIWSTANTNDATLKQLMVNLPDDVQFDQVSKINELIELGKQHHYDCILADISTSEEHFDNLQKIRENNLFSGTSLILLIDQEISSTDEMRLKKISEAIVMKSKEAHKRLKDELEIFMFHVNDHKPKEEESKEERLKDSNILDGKKVLVADDDMRNVFALVGLLENHKMEVLTASNGLEALEMLEKEPKIDIVLMDIMMPEMDGYEAMRNIRSNKKYNDLPIIALTAKAMSNDRELCIEAGASDYMSKPINSQKLLSLIRIWLS
jgi:signal transduction histidine kinase/CheY-like chemotaxis protein/CHASE3 domain sensor protein